ncbi:hypothetical protein ABE10_00255, partial [Bacillus toyonensis]|nr:hypothetical protein [Bacillus toyonensis]
LLPEGGRARARERDDAAQRVLLGVGQVQLGEVGHGSAVEVLLERLGHHIAAGRRLTDASPIVRGVDRTERNLGIPGVGGLGARHRLPVERKRFGLVHDVLVLARGLGRVHREGVLEHHRLGGGVLLPLERVVEPDDVVAAEPGPVDRHRGRRVAAALHVVEELVDGVDPADLHVLHAPVTQRVDDRDGLVVVVADHRGDVGMGGEQVLDHRLGGDAVLAAALPADELDAGELLQGVLDAQLPLLGGGVAGQTRDVQDLALAADLFQHRSGHVVGVLHVVGQEVPDVVL